MHIPGHLAVVLLEQRLLTTCLPRRAVVKPLFIASFFPDVVDKSIGYLFHWMPNGRHYTHNLFSLFLLSAIVALIWGKNAGYAWFVGHFGHLLADTNSRSTVPWLFPFKRYAFVKGKLRFRRKRLMRETILLGFVWLLLRRSR